MSRSCARADFRRAEADLVGQMFGQVPVAIRRRAYARGASIFGFFQLFATAQLAHGLALQLHAMRLMSHSIQDGVGYGWIASSAFMDTVNFLFK